MGSRDPGSNPGGPTNLADGMHFVRQPTLHLSLKEGLLFLSLEEWKDLAVHFKKSDLATMRLIKHGWKGKLPFTEKDVCDIVLIMLEKCPKFGPMLARRLENKSRRLHQLLKENNKAKEKIRQ